MAEEEQVTEEVEKNALGLSDAEIGEMSPEDFTASQEPEPKAEEETEEEEQEPEETSEEEPEAEPEEEEAEPEPERDVYGSESTDESEEPEEESEPEPKSEPKEKEPEDPGVDYKAQYDELFKPFRASGREVKINTVDDARRLMQMGVDYQKKMRALKPHLRIMKALEKNDLLDEDKVNLLIDIEQKNPKAVAKFLKDKEIDPYTLDLEEENAYTPKSHAPSEKEMELDDVLDNIRETDTFQRTVDEVAKWDGDSKQVLMENPNLVKVLNDHMGAGIYDQIMGIVESERMLGRLAGLSNLAAYKQIGDVLQSKGAFAHLNSEPKPARKSVQDRKLKDRKRAASPTKRTVRKPKEKFNPLALSDEEFEKVAANQHF